MRRLAGVSERKPAAEILSLARDLRFTTEAQRYRGIHGAIKTVTRMAGVASLKWRWRRAAPAIAGAEPRPYTGKGKHNHGRTQVAKGWKGK